MAKEINVLKIDAPRQKSKGWKRTYSEINTQDVGEGWQEEMAQSAKYVLEESWVKANDPHYDAKVLFFGSNCNNARLLGWVGLTLSSACY